MGTNSNSKKVTVDGSIMMALKVAHNTNNKKVITKDFALGAGCTEDAFTKWENTVDSLYSRVEPWVEKFNSSKVTDEELQALYAEVFPTYKRLINQTGEKIFIRESDAVRICGFAHKHGQSAHGSVDVLKSKKMFRKEIETMFGIRLAASEILKEDDYKIITSYEKAVKNIESLTNTLEGYERDGKKIEGLKTRLEKAEDDLSKMKALVISIGGDEKDIENNPLMSAYQKNVSDLKATIKNIEGKIDKSKKTVEDNKKKYEELLKKIPEIA